MNMQQIFLAADIINSGTLPVKQYTHVLLTELQQLLENCLYNTRIMLLILESWPKVFVTPSLGGPLQLLVVV